MRERRMHDEDSSEAVSSADGDRSNRARAGLQRGLGTEGGATVHLLARRSDARVRRAARR